MADSYDKPFASVKESPQASESNYAQVDETDFQAIDPHSGVKRGLKTRHLSMMALAGIIGPGLLIGSGGECRLNAHHSSSAQKES